MKCWCGKGRKEGRKRETRRKLLFMIDFWPDQRKIRPRNFFPFFFSYFLRKFKHSVSLDLKHSYFINNYGSLQKCGWSVLLRSQVLWSMNLNLKIVIYELYDDKPSSIETGLTKATISSEIMHINCLAKFLILRKCI